MGLEPDYVREVGPIIYNDEARFLKFLICLVRKEKSKRRRKQDQRCHTTPRREERTTQDDDHQVSSQSTQDRQASPNEDRPRREDRTTQDDDSQVSSQKGLKLAEKYLGLGDKSKAEKLGQKAIKRSGKTIELFIPKIKSEF